MGLEEHKGAPAQGVIWITGYSAAGKTTVGRKVEARLRATGMQTIFLDGDDLRSIFGSNWGFDRASRTELAHVYFRLCSHLASQGYVVVISAVAMYREVLDWVAVNIPRSMQVYLRVPQEERKRRDAETKGIYRGGEDFADMYDEPRGADLELDNFGTATPDEMAMRIVDAFLSGKAPNFDLGRTSHWSSFYSGSAQASDPSPFAVHVADRLERPGKLLEVGCGNGRDAGYFAARGHSVTAIDFAEAAIEKCRREHAGSGVDFLAGRLDDLAPILPRGFDVVYSRFVLHAMPLDEEVRLLEAAHALLGPGGGLHVECRSINDPMARKGEVISPTERIHGHYRRFLVMDELVGRLADAGFVVESSLESNGLAVFGDEDPVVIRILARKPA